MLNSSRLRSLVRKLRLQRLLAPLVNLLEERSLARLGSYKVSEPAPGTLAVSGFGRQLEITALPSAQIRLGQSPHERPTMCAFLSRIRAGDVVWDVGANVGFYTRLAAELAGPIGAVVAFEPGPATFKELSGNLSRAAVANVQLMNMALSDTDGTASFATSSEYFSVGRIVTGSAGTSAEMISVPTARADTLVADGRAKPPTFLKIDVEGHELAVVKGMEHLLAAPACKGVLVEVHFSLLEKNGLPHAASEIECSLHRCGLSNQQWIARSHLLAVRM